MLYSSGAIAMHHFIVHLYNNIHLVSYTLPFCHTGLDIPRMRWHVNFGQGPCLMPQNWLVTVVIERKLRQSEFITVAIRKAC